MDGEKEIRGEILDKIMTLARIAQNYFNEGEYDNAIVNLKKSIKLIPEPKEAYEVTTILYKILGSSYFCEDDFKNTIKTLLKALRCTGGIGNSEIMFRIGQSYFELEDFRRAKNYFYQAYMLGEMFEDEEDKKYFALLKAID